MIFQIFLRALKMLPKTLLIENNFKLQIDKDMYSKVLGYIKAGKEGGAKCVAGGDKVGDKGYYIKPTVFADVTDNMKIAREEASPFSFCS